MDVGAVRPVNVLPVIVGDRVRVTPIVTYALKEKRMPRFEFVNVLPLIVGERLIAGVPPSRPSRTSIGVRRSRNELLSICASNLPPPPPSNAEMPIEARLCTREPELDDPRSTVPMNSLFEIVGASVF